jgi:hypothetical protein
MHQLRIEGDSGDRPLIGAIVRSPDLDAWPDEPEVSLSRNADHLNSDQQRIRGRNGKVGHGSAARAPSASARGFADPDGAAQGRRPTRSHGRTETA